MTDTERLMAIKVSLIRSMTVNRELIDLVQEESGYEFNPGREYEDGAECFHEGTNYGVGSYAETLLGTYFRKEG